MPPSEIPKDLKEVVVKSLLKNTKNFDSLQLSNYRPGLNIFGQGAQMCSDRTIPGVWVGEVRKNIV